MHACVPLASSHIINSVYCSGLSFALCRVEALLPAGLKHRSPYHCGVRVGDLVGDDSKSTSFQAARLSVQAVHLQAKQAQSLVTGWARATTLPS